MNDRYFKIPEPEQINYARIGSICVLASLLASPIKITCTDPQGYLEGDSFIIEQLLKLVGQIVELNKDIEVIVNLIAPEGLMPLEEKDKKCTEILLNPYTHSFEKEFWRLQENGI